MKLFDWDFSAPKSEPLGDHEVVFTSEHLRGKKIALLVCGGIAAMKAPLVARALRRRGAEVVAFCSPDALHYVGKEGLEWATCHPLVTALTWKSEHLSGDQDFSAYLVAPATYNTIGKAAQGIADTVISAVLASALGRMQRGQTQVLFAPTMHGSMHHQVLIENCKRLVSLGAKMIPPRDASGKHNLPDEELIAAAVCRSVSQSTLKGKKILVTGGPTPVPIDGVRRILNRFRGRLGAAIHEELLLRGAESTFILGDGAWQPAPWLPIEVASTYQEYREAVVRHMKLGQVAGIFSAGVADYQPKSIHSGKIPSGQKSLNLELVGTEKVIELARKTDPHSFIVSFKYLEQVTHEELMAVARDRLEKYPVVVANRGEECQELTQVSYIVTRDGEQRFEGKARIAQGIADLLEKKLP
ncbi:phosphopantothenoylcysteine decarboxylase [bacterium]|nr:phosphopantothenoylcysteine decarboxylase [bacterium]